MEQSADYQKIISDQAKRMNTGQKYVQLTVDLAIRASGGGWDTENDQINCKILTIKMTSMF